MVASGTGMEQMHDKSLMAKIRQKIAPFAQPRLCLTYSYWQVHQVRGKQRRSGSHIMGGRKSRLIGLESPPEKHQPKSTCFCFALVDFVSFVSFVVSSPSVPPSSAEKHSFGMRQYASVL